MSFTVGTLDFGQPPLLWNLVIYYNIAVSNHL